MSRVCGTLKKRASVAEQMQTQLAAASLFALMLRTVYGLYSSVIYGDRSGNCCDNKQ